jgi:hypothetical protein
MRAETQDLTQATLLECLRLTPNLQEFLAQQHIDAELSQEVISLLFTLPRMKTLDFCSCSSPSFTAIFGTVILEPLAITRLSLHECSSLPTSVFGTLLSRLPCLIHLDLANTRVTDEGLLKIRPTARLSHLNLSRCALLSGASVVGFFTTHSAAKELVFVNLSADIKSFDVLTSEDLTTLISSLPTTLRYLNLQGTKMDSTHIHFLFIAHWLDD